jgi:hypothetical protein
VPAAAVIPALVAYTKVVVVKKLVVGKKGAWQKRRGSQVGLCRRSLASLKHWGNWAHMPLSWCVGLTHPPLCFEKIGVFKAGVITEPLHNRA